jgi:hypothetical protein
MEEGSGQQTEKSAYQIFTDFFGLILFEMTTVTRIARSQRGCGYTREVRIIKSLSS